MRTPAVASSAQSAIAAWCARSSASICPVVQLPIRIQSTLGGEPRRTLSSLKSVSRVTIGYPWSRA